MPKEMVSESRNDFRGGLNVYISPDLLNSNELSTSQNSRVDTNGPVTKRKGTKRLHASALAAAPIKGITQWDGPSGSQIVAICNGDLFYRNQSSGEFAAFTQVDPGTTDAFSTTSPALFATLRGTDSGAPLRLYIASGGKVYEWSGTTLLRLDINGTGTTGQMVPDASLIQTYHLRLFTNTLVRPQHLVWSRLADGRNFKGGLAGDGGTAMVSAIQADPIIALQTIGRSLLVFTNESVARVAGYSANDIRIDQDTEGLSPEVGIVGPLAVTPADRIIFFMSEKGAYLATEDAITPIGLKVQPIFDGMDRTKLDQIVVGHHHSRAEIWVAYSDAADDTLNKSILVYNLRHQAWYGPFVLNWASDTAGITCMCSYSDPNGDDFILAGSSDGFIRHMDTGSKDDVLSDGTVGNTFGHSFTLAPFFFGDAQRIHGTRYVFCQAKLPTTSSLGYAASVHPGTGASTVLVYTAPTVLDTSLIQSYKSYPASNNTTGQRLSFLFSGGQDNFPELHGITVYAHRFDRVL